jgi:plastocyanin
MRKMLTATTGLMLATAAVAVTAVVALVTGVVPSAGASTSAATISIVDSGASCTTTFCYQPSQLTVPSGATVTWTDKSVTAHTVTRCDSSACTGMGPGSGSDPAFDSGSMAPNATYSLTFHGVGTYNYYCVIHGFSAMHGTVTVMASPTTTTTAASPTTTATAAGGAATTTTTSPAATTPTSPPTAGSGSASSAGPTALAQTGPSPSLWRILVVGAILVTVGVLSLAYLAARRDGSRRRAH